MRYRPRGFGSIELGTHELANLDEAREERWKIDRHDPQHDLPVDTFVVVRDAASRPHHLLPLDVVESASQLRR